MMIMEFTTIHEASIAAVKKIIEIARHAIVEKGICTIVLAGGASPKLTYEHLSDPSCAQQIDWHRCHFFWGDERWVAATHPDSNFALANKTFLAKLHIPRYNIHQIPTDQTKPEIGAAMYEKHLRSFFHSQPLAATNSIDEISGCPSFDLILLGMGPDGHTASLFPGSDLLEEKKKWVAAVEAGVGSPPVPRITLTLPVLNQARNILFIIAGNRKRKILDAIVTQPGAAETLYPAARIKPAGNLIWLVAEKG